MLKLLQAVYPAIASAIVFRRSPVGICMGRQPIAMYYSSFLVTLLVIVRCIPGNSYLFLSILACYNPILPREEFHVDGSSWSTSLRTGVGARGFRILGNH
jgi:hypothetical protein